MATVKEMMAAKRAKKCNTIKKYNQNFLKAKPCKDKYQLQKHRNYFKSLVFNDDKFFKARARARIARTAKDKFIFFLETGCEISHTWLIALFKSIILMAKFYNLSDAKYLTEKALEALYGNASAYYCWHAINLIDQWLQIFPRKFVVYMWQAARAVEVVLHGVEFVSYPEWQIVSTWRIVNGMSLRDAAKLLKEDKYIQKESELREIILDAGLHLNMIISLYERIERLDSITQLRDPHYQKLHGTLLNWIAGLKTTVINQVEFDTGLSLLR